MNKKHTFSTLKNHQTQYKQLVIPVLTADKNSKISRFVRGRRLVVRVPPQEYLLNYA
ncbi:hypothetical protein [Providencia sp. PROV147]|uniref:hypothetical protein n=1 Tax=Providencia sp. PROV147 TaxID=2949857 RepID=UPI00234BB0EA|nr:hypothetical protein [Providencia sp. PROV147]